MARTHARVKVRIWIDEDFRSLPPEAQHLYFVLLTAENLSYCGVADWRPARIAPHASGWSVQRVLAAAHILEDRLYIVVDEDTEEVLLRSFIRNDGLMDQPNMATAMVRAYAGVSSRIIRGVVVHELNRLIADEPGLKGWGNASVLLSNPSVNPSDHPSVWGSINPSTNPSVNPSLMDAGTLPETLPETHPPLLTPSPTPYSPLPTTSEVAAAPTDDDPELDDVPPIDNSRPDIERVCKHLQRRMVENGFPRPAITQRWREAARLLMGADGRTEAQVHAAIDWASDNDFWRPNIKSMPTLRKQFTTMHLQAQTEAKKRNATNRVTSEADAQVMRYLERSNGGAA